MKRCAVCGKKLPDNPHPRLKYCSDECRREGAERLRRAKRKAESLSKPKQICLRCGRKFRRFSQGTCFYCPKCRVLIQHEHCRNYYRKKKQESGQLVEKHYCPNCGVEIRIKGETFCSRCRRKYKILR